MNTPKRPAQDPRTLNIGAKLGLTFTDEQIDMIHASVTEGPKDHYPTMTEATFRDYFLPVLAGVVVDPDRLQIYLQGTGSFAANVGVNIIDDQGQFLFEVPPFLSTDHVKPLPDSPDAMTFGDISKNVSLMQHRSPMQAIGMMNVAFHRRLLSGHIKHYEPTAAERKWVEIFKRYGYEVKEPWRLSEENQAILHQPVSTAPAQAATSTPDSDDVELSGEF